MHPHTCVRLYALLCNVKKTKKMIKVARVQYREYSMGYCCIRVCWMRNGSYDAQDDECASGKNKWEKKEEIN